jgi:hypothetical protein
MSGATSNDIANQAIQMLGDNTPEVTGFAPNFDQSAAGIALQKLYYPCVQTVVKQFGWEFARSNAELSLSGNAAPFGWSYEYIYPSSAVEVLQVLPPSIADVNNPLPIDWAVGNSQVSSAQTKVIWSNQVSASAVINNAPIESTWDALFREAVVRLLASELAIAIAGKPDTAEQLLQSGSAFETLGEGRGG